MITDNDILNILRAQLGLQELEVGSRLSAGRHKGQREVERTTLPSLRK